MRLPEIIDNGLIHKRMMVAPSLSLCSFHWLSGSWPDLVAPLGKGAPLPARRALRPTASRLAEPINFSLFGH